MDSPFLQENSSNPFQHPYPQQQTPVQGSASTIKPFAALDLGPQGNSQGGNPFLENFQSPFVGHEAPAAESGSLNTPENFSMATAPIHTPPPVAARQSQIMAREDYSQGISASSVKPRFFMTTTSAVDGFSVQAYLGVVSVEIVVPKDLLLRNPAPYGELNRIKACEEQLQKVKDKAMEELAERARQMQADGVVGVTVHFSQFDAVVSLCSAVGTAVRLAV